MPRVVQPKRKQAAKLPIGRMKPDAGTDFRLRIFRPDGKEVDKGYGTASSMKKWREHYKALGYRVRKI